MPANASVTPQSRTFSLWNIFSRQTAPPRVSENSFPLLSSVVSVSSSQEEFSIAELKEGQYIRQAVEALQNGEQSGREIPHTSSKGWKIAAVLVGVAGVFGTAALYYNHVVNAPARTLMPVDERFPPIIDTALNESAATNNHLPRPEPQVASLHYQNTPADNIHNEIALFKINVNTCTPHDILVSANHLNNQVQEFLNINAIPPQSARIFGRKIADIISTQLEPLIRNLIFSKLILKVDQFNDDLNQLRIESVNRELNEANKSKEVLTNLVVKLNRVYLDANAR
ncbi:hypothetical protein [Vagococcus sp. WN89Y]|uniref:hypothetical protein n=1 Tax=Vagococcus sp. WN89Y TaxID=3457258 RepID=UPI003FCE6035